MSETYKILTGRYDTKRAPALGAVGGVLKSQETTDWDYRKLGQNMICASYRATRMHSADYAVARCLSVRLSVCQSVCLSVYPSHTGIVFFHNRVATPF